MHLHSLENLLEELTDAANIDKIENGLFLGNLTAAVDVSVLSLYRISHILTVESQPLPLFVTSLPGMAYMHINVFDQEEDDMLTHFLEVSSFIQDGQIKGNVLVHCYFGMSRSAAAVACFLMRKYCESVDQTMARIKSRRKYVCPNSGFLRQLKLFELMGWKLDTMNRQYRLYLLKLTSKSILKVQKTELTNNFFDWTKSCLAYDGLDNPVVFRCRMCRLALVTRNDVIPHIAGETPHWVDEKWSQLLGESMMCKAGVSVLPLPWMEGVQSCTDGKINCPKCRGKIGAFSWCQGYSCPCGAKVPVYLIATKLDKCNL